MKNLKFVFVLFAVLGLGFILAACTDVSAQEDAYVTIDINPSIELIVTPSEIVVYANALNEDGELLLVNLELVGLNLTVAINLILDEAINLGFIDPESPETIVSIDTISTNEQVREKIHNRIKERINEGFQNRAIMGRAEDHAFIPEFVTEAFEYGVTPGFLRLAKSALEMDDLLTLEEALLLSQQELMAIVRTAKDNNQDIRLEIRQEFHEAREAIFETYHPQIEALEEQVEALEALIELGEGDIEAYLAELETLLGELEALEEEMIEAFHEVRDAFIEQNQAIIGELKLRNEMRIQEHRDRVEAYRNEMQERKEAIEEAIKEYQRQGGNPGRP